ncbi:MAG: hypothetical protein HQL28_02795, partial [Candidatus Omnitrophica bacterium]|nr:hypothetical protein [Candidatus Omnitrophota bacterium]
EELEKKHKAISFYRTEIEYSPRFLYTFARKNELFGDFDPVKIKCGEVKETPVGGMTFAYLDGKLIIRIDLKQKIEKDLGVVLYLFGYKEGIDFGEMPKIRIALTLEGLNVKDKCKSLLRHGIRVEEHGLERKILVPVSLLGDPDHIMTSLRSNTHAFSSENTAWRIIEMEKQDKNT